MFQLKERKTTFRREFVAGLTTFAAMAYILAVNPEILSQTGMPREALITVTALIVAIGSILMALIANFPFAMGPGLSTATYFSYFMCGKMGFTWEQGLSIVFWTGLIFLLLIVSGVKRKIVESISDSLKIGIQCGIGFFIAFVGLKSTGIIVADKATLVTEGDLLSPTVLLVLFSFLLMGALTIRRFSGAIVLTIILATIAGFWVTDAQGEFVTKLPETFVSLPHGIAETFLKLDWLYPIKNIERAFVPILSLLLLTMFDVLGAFVALTRQAKFMDKKGHILNFSRGLSVNALSTIIGSLMGTSASTNFLESSAGVEAGGRTGVTSLTVAGLFLIALFFTPLIAIVPNEATAPALILIGIFLLQGLRLLNFDDFSEAAPALFTMVMIPLTFSIAKGFSLGFVFYVGLKILSGRSKDLTPTTILLGILFVGYFCAEYLF